MVKELQQGSQIESPVEVRISGGDIAVLKKLGSQVEGILRGDDGWAGATHTGSADLADQRVAARRQ